VFLQISFAALVALAFAQADRYPAGVNPASCPNYPFCDNAALNALQLQYQQYSAPLYPADTQYSALQFNPTPYAAQ